MYRHYRSFHRLYYKKTTRAIKKLIMLPQHIFALLDMRWFILHGESEFERDFLIIISPIKRRQTGTLHHLKKKNTIKNEIAKINYCSGDCSGCL